MNFKLIALIASATAVIAAPASEDVQADVIDTHAGVPETAGTRVSTVARHDQVRAHYHREPQEARPNSYDPRRKCRVGYAQCCNRLQEASQDVIAALLTTGRYTGINVDPDTPTVIAGLECVPFDELFSSCSSTPVCCDNIEPTGRLAIGCRPITFQ